MPRGLAFDVHGWMPGPVKLIDLIWDHVAIDWLVSEKISHFPRSLLVVDSLNGLLALLLGPKFESVIEICTTTKTSINIKHKRL